MNPYRNPSIADTFRRVNEPGLKLELHWIEQLLKWWRGR
jgi:hypothetical protein